MRAALGAILGVMLLALAPAHAAERRLALVIGNSAYSFGALDNPKNDAALMAKALKGVGFEVTELIDADQKTMKKAMLDFGRSLRDSDSVGLFYYAGHGVQVDGENYLVPVDANIRDEADVAVEAVAATELLKTMQRAASRINIAIFDACRNNPFASTTRGGTRGLARIDAPAGTIIAYATAPGDVALDGQGGNSPYATALAKNMAADGLTVEEVFKRARREVKTETRALEGELTKASKHVREMVDEAMKGSLDKLLKPTRRAIDESRVRLDRLEKKIERMGRPAPARRAAARTRAAKPKRAAARA